MLAPLGPLADWQIASFWRSFYASLVETLEIDEAMTRGQGTGLTAMALFLRHSHVRLFRNRAAHGQAAAEDPAQIDAELQLSRGLVEQLRAAGERFGGVSDEVTKLLESEMTRQERLVEQLDPWLKMEEDEL